MLDTKALAEVTASIVKEHVASVLAPVMARLEAVEARQHERGEKGEPGEPGPQGESGPPGEKGETGADGKDGESVDMEEVRALIVEQVEKITPTLVEKVAEVVPKPRDGVGVAGAIIDRDGELTLTLTDGTTRGLGRVVGHDGAPGEKGEPGRDGIDGKDGADGVGFDDMQFVENEKGAFLRFVQGDKTRDFRLPIVMDRGVYKSGTDYLPGDAVTWGGSLWIAQEPTSDKPDAGKGWRLAVKRGRDGKDGRDGERGPPATVQKSDKDKPR